MKGGVTEYINILWVLLQDLALLYDIVAESFETSVPWDRCHTLCTNVKKRIEVVRKILE